MGGSRDVQWSAQIPSNAITTGLGKTPQEILTLFGDNLTPVERSELFTVDRVWYFGLHNRGLGTVNLDYDDAYNHYVSVQYEHLNFRYEVLEWLVLKGQSQLFRCRDHKTNTMVNVKMWRQPTSPQDNHMQAMQLKIFIRLQELANDFNVKLLDHFYFRGHNCLVLEDLCNPSVSHSIKSMKSQRDVMAIVKLITKSILRILNQLHAKGIVHGNIKPRNLSFKDALARTIRIKNVESSFFPGSQCSQIFGTRAYLAPEAFLGHAASFPVDMWALGCTVAELATGSVLFPAVGRYDQLPCYMEVLGMPPESLVNAAPERNKYFDPLGNPVMSGQDRVPGSNPISVALGSQDTEFNDFISRCLEWDPTLRMTPVEALVHPWLGRTPPDERVPRQPAASAQEDEMQQDASVEQHEPGPQAGPQVEQHVPGPQAGPQMEQHEPGPQVEQHEPGPQVEQHEPGLQDGLQVEQHEPGLQVEQHEPGPQVEQHVPGLQAGPQVEQHVPGPQAGPQVEQHEPGPQVEQHEPGPQVEQHEPGPQVEQHVPGPQVEQHVPGPQDGPQVEQHEPWLQDGLQVEQHEPGPQVEQHEPGPQVEQHEPGPQVEQQVPGLQDGLQVEQHEPGLQRADEEKKSEEEEENREQKNGEEENRKKKHSQAAL
ncbi:dual specificity tyrosine-phosphorylation-regulated kinase 4-like [Lethenteron reissneri]|uniref:dual specificity tyrosine-phosphorylation-regulated kinase 4-like n=1 Tax=Lethenteron reissneri TaxID=7753 RepID=UPI002AB5DEB4|nr:dual specificity tyrosine-phosphorylation-regulated kinase 4-like [Lethenteron reissneri]